MSPDKAYVILARARDLSVPSDFRPTAEQIDEARRVTGLTIGDLRENRPRVA